MRTQDAATFTSLSSISPSSASDLVPLLRRNAGTATSISAQHGQTTARGLLSRYALRVSLLEQCSYRCPYCLPGAVQPYTERNRWLSASDYARLAPIFADLGVAKVRFTGGEPLLRADLIDVIQVFRQAMPKTELALTTNGQRLAKIKQELRRSGLDRLTIHIDSLQKERYTRLMGDGDPQEILQTALSLGDIFGQIKINVVLQRGQNDDEMLDFLRLSQETGVEVRFIELMNTGSASEYTKSVFLSGAEALSLLQKQIQIKPIARRHESDPAALYQTETGITFGVIASDTEPFCHVCDRLRLTADGRLRGCLYEAGGTDVGSHLRKNVSAEELRSIVIHGAMQKRSFHPNTANERRPFSMADVGG